MSNLDNALTLAAVLVAGADGHISQIEIDAAVAGGVNLDKLNALAEGFDVNAGLNQLKGLQLTADEAKKVVDLSIAVADAENGIDDDEQAMIDSISSIVAA